MYVGRYEVPLRAAELGDEREVVQALCLARAVAPPMAELARGPEGRQGRMGPGDYVARLGEFLPVEPPERLRGLGYLGRVQVVDHLLAVDVPDEREAALR